MLIIMIKKLRGICVDNYKAVPLEELLRTGREPVGDCDVEKSTSPNSKDRAVGSKPSEATKTPGTGARRDTSKKKGHKSSRAAATPHSKKRE